MTKSEKFPVTITEEGVSAKIRKFSLIKNGKTYNTFVAEYFLLGKRNRNGGQSLRARKPRSKPAGRFP
jgi:hypothetical protein